MKPSPEAIRANAAGLERADAGDRAGAIPLYEEAARLSPQWYAPQLNLGIAFKHTRQWSASLAASLRAIELDAKEAGVGPVWNVGIAATALGDWKRARWAWKQFGLKLPRGDGPIEANLGPTPIRVFCGEHTSVLWCRRIDPARAVVKSVPTPESDHRFGDLLLHDGEPKGKRELDGEQVSVFDELTILERSAFRTWAVDVRAESQDELDTLFDAATNELDIGIEDWTASLHLLCNACSEGLDVEHHHPPAPPWTPERRVAIATVDERVFAIVRAWASARRGRSASKPELLTP